MMLNCVGNLLGGFTAKTNLRISATCDISDLLLGGKQANLLHILNFLDHFKVRLPRKRPSEFQLREKLWVVYQAENKLNHCIYWNPQAILNCVYRENGHPNFSFVRNPGSSLGGKQAKLLHILKFLDHFKVRLPRKRPSEFQFQLHEKLRAVYQAETSQMIVYVEIVGPFLSAFTAKTTVRISVS